MQSVMWRWKNEKPPKRQGFWNVEKMGGEPVQKEIGALIHQEKLQRKCMQDYQIVNSMQPVTCDLY